MFDKHKGKKTNPARVSEPGLEPQSLSRSPPSAPVSRTSAVIGQGIVIKGDITGDENLRIEGKVSGSVILPSHEVSIGQSGEIMADVTAKIIRVAGKVKGDLTGTEKVILANTGRVQGNIMAPRMILEDGALFKGTIDMTPVEPVKAPEARPAPQVAAKPQVATKPEAAAKPASTPGLVADPAKKTPDLALKRG